jgi:vitamin B12/bleomycin/antimicrobial peptide transport system ATP-binding/permease protein
MQPVLTSRRTALQLVARLGRVPGGFGWGLGIVVATVAILFINIAVNGWNASFYAAIEARDRAGFVRGLVTFALLSLAFVLASVLQVWSLQSLQWRWRRVLVRQCLPGFGALARSGVDNPDQRVADDLRLFTGTGLQIAVGALAALASALWFGHVLWQLAASSPGALPPPLLLACAVLYALFGVGAVAWVAAPLVPRGARQQALEADLRAALLAARGAPDTVQPARLGRLLDRALRNFTQIVSRQRGLTFVAAGHGQLGMILPVALAAPAYLAGGSDLGGMMQLASAIEQVAVALAFLVRSWSDIVELRATLRRLMPVVALYEEEPA